MFTRKFVRAISILLLLFFSAVTSVSAKNTYHANQGEGTRNKIHSGEAGFNFFPYIPRASISGDVGSFSRGSGNIIVPVVGNNNNLVFGDIQGRYGRDNSWYGAVGGGLRHIIHNQIIVGAYVFGDRSVSESKNVFWDVSPGIEMMTTHWDAHINGYFPTQKRRYLDGPFFGDQIGIGEFVQFEGHTQYDNIFNEYESVGNGVDSEVGYTLLSKIPLFKKVRFYVGGYHFAPKHGGNINGGLAGVSLQISHYAAVKFTDNYDNLHHNSGLLSLSVHFGGGGKFSAEDIHSRMLDAIPRALGTPVSGMAIPTRKEIVNTGERVVEHSNVWFFSPTGAPYNPLLGNNQGIFGNPVSSDNFTQDVINSINGFAPNANFFLSPGIYALESPTSLEAAYGVSKDITLFNGQSMFGRSTDYKLPALGDNRAMLLGRINLAGNNNLNNLILNGDGSGNNIGIFANNTGNISMDHVLVENYRGTEAGQSGQSATGIDIENSNDVVLNYVVVDNITGGNGAEVSMPAGAATGLKLIGGDNITIKNSEVTNIRGADGQASTSISQSGQRGGGATGINVSDSSNATVENSMVSNLTSGNGGNIFGDGSFNAGDGGNVVGINGGTTVLNNNLLGSFIAGSGGDNFDISGFNTGSAGNAGSVTGITGASSGTTISGNTLRGVFTGGNGGSDDFEQGGNGGNITGIVGASGAVISNNTFSGIFTGGNGGNSGSVDGGSGGSVIGIRSNGSSDSGNIFHSWAVNATGGIGGLPGGTDGTVVQIQAL